MIIQIAPFFWGQFSHWWVLFFRNPSCVITFAFVEKYFIAIFLLVFGIILLWKNSITNNLVIIYIVGLILAIKKGGNYCEFL